MGHYASQQDGRTRYAVDNVNSDGDTCRMCGAHVEGAGKGLTQLRGTDMSFDTVRSKLAGLHFSKECLTSGEREILHLAELLMNLIDSEDPSGYRR